MQVIVHAGLPKTGSSALQDYLASHREQLQRQGIIYPDLDGYESHWAVAAAFMDNPKSHFRVKRRMRGKDVQQTLAGIVQDLRDCLAAAKPEDVVILSGESISGSGVGFRDLLLDYTKAVHVIAYGRDPLHLYPSDVQQRLKSLGSEIPTPSDWVSTHGPRARSLINVFGEARCEMRIHSPATLIARDVIADFADFLRRTTGKDIPLPSGTFQTNTSLSGPACAILMALRTGASNSIDRKVYGNIRNLLGRFGEVHSAPKLTIPEAWRSALIAKNYRSWNALVDMTRYDEEQKAALRLPALSKAEPISHASLTSWLLSYGDPDYASEFTAFCRENAWNKMGRTAQVAKLMEHVSLYNVDLGRPRVYGSSRIAEAEVAGMAISSKIDQLVEVVKSLSDEDIDRLSKIVKRERKRRGLKTSKGKNADQGEEDDED